MLYWNNEEDIKAIEEAIKLVEQEIKWLEAMREANENRLFMLECELGHHY